MFAGLHNFKSSTWAMNLKKNYIILISYRSYALQSTNAKMENP